LYICKFTTQNKKMRKKLILIITFVATSYFLNAQNSFIINTAGNTFSPDTLTITVGDTVTWNNTQGFHNINATLSTYPSNPEGFGNAVAGAGWSFQWVFTIQGTYDYQCDPHAGIGMTGVIIANPIISICNKSLEQHLNGFNPDPLYAFWDWAYDTISLTNTSNCDLRIRPEFHIYHDSLIIGITDFDLKWYNPYIGNWPDIPHNIDANGVVVGFWGFGGDSTGTQITQGSAQQIIIKIRFRPSANYGTYSANWITQEVDSSGNILQAITNGDSTSVNLIDCSIFNIDSSYSTNISCFNENNGSASIVSIQNGSNDYLYNWNNGDTTNFTNNLQEGNYYCIVTDKNWQQCSDSIGFTISEPAELSSTANIINLTCYGDSNGVATLNVNGGTSPYTETWNGGSQYNLQAGDYYYTLTDFNSCTFSDSVHIYQPSQLNSSISSLDITNCESNDGIIDLSVSGGTGTYSYIWSNNDTTEDLDNLTSGTYSVTITDFNFCSTTNSATINNFNSTLTTSLSSPTYNGYNIQCFGGSNGSIFSNTNGGVGSLTYNWSNGQNTSIDTNLSAGLYSLIVTDSLNCTASDSILLSEPNELTSTYTQSNVSCYDVNDGSAIVNFFGGTSGSSAGDTNYILGWAGTPLPIYLPYPQTVFNTSLLPPPYNAIPAGIYPYTVTDLNGCIIYDTITIIEPDSLSIALTAPAICCPGGNDGIATAIVNGGTGPYSYLWNGATTQVATGLSSGTYSCTVTDSNGCAIQDSITINENAPITASFTLNDPLCYGDNSGCIYTTASGGDGNYTYLWDDPLAQTTADICNLSAGTYTCLVTDGCGCIHSFSVTLSVPDEISLNVNSLIDITIYGGNDGFIYISPYGGSGLLNTSWTSDNGFTSNNEDITNLSAGFYYLEITDSNSCTYLDTVELTQPSSLWINLDLATNTSCFDSCNGALNITANGGDSSYTYNWTGPNGFTSTNNNLTNLCAGAYIIIVNDGITTITETFNIIQPQSITSNLLVDSIICHNDLSQVEINVWGGTQPFIYNWSNGSNSYITTVHSGTHSIHVTDQNGCSINQSFSLTNPDSIISITSSTNINCFGGNNGSISINILNGGISPYNFSDDNGLSYQISNTFSNLLAGNYSFLISDTNGCLGSAYAEVIQPSVLTSTTTAIDASCYGYCDGSVTANALGGTSPYSYTWTNGASNLCPGFYNVIVSDINGCIGSNSAIVNEPNPLLINISIDGSNIIATSGFTSYQWYDNNNNPINGATDSIFTPLGMGFYYLTVTDTNACSADSYSIEYTISSFEDYSSSINIFPNPTNGNITVTSEYSIKTIELYNTIGNELYLVNNNENKITETKLDLSTFAKGVYFIKININNQIIHQRIILQ